jgi:HNH endonuclease
MNIITRIESLRTREHEATVALITALLECDRSEDHVALGYSGMWDFLVSHLNYSNAAASRRYKAMKCARKFPQVLDMLRKHQTNLSALAQAEATLAKAADPQELLGEICGKSQRQVEEVLARHNPQPKKKEQIRRVTVKSAAGSAASPPPDQDLFTEPTSAPEVRTSEAATSAPEQPTPPTPQLEERVAISFSVRAETYEEFEKARLFLSRKLPQGVTMEAAFEELLDFYLKHKAPKNPRPSKQRASRKTASKPGISADNTVHPNHSNRTVHRTTRHIPAAVRRDVFERDGHRCTYAGLTGKQCGSSYDLELDHIQPFAVGGKHVADNLRVLCATHNQHRAKDTFKESTPRYLISQHFQPKTPPRSAADFRCGTDSRRTIPTWSVRESASSDGWSPGAPACPTPRMPSGNRDSS